MISLRRLLLVLKCEEHADRLHRLHLVILTRLTLLLRTRLRLFPAVVDSNFSTNSFRSLDASDLRLFKEYVRAWGIVDYENRDHQ